MITRKSLYRRSRHAAALASVVCLLSTATVLPAEARELSVKVDYKDLNLSTMNGASTLYLRIEGAARFVCGEPGRRIDELRYWKTCYSNAVNHAVTEVNSPLLTSLYRKQYGGTSVTAMRTR